MLSICTGNRRDPNICVVSVWLICAVWSGYSMLSICTGNSLCCLCLANLCCSVWPIYAVNMCRQWKKPQHLCCLCLANLCCQYVQAIEETPTSVLSLANLCCQYVQAIAEIQTICVVSVWLIYQGEGRKKYLWRLVKMGCGTNITYNI